VVRHDGILSDILEGEDARQKYKRKKTDSAGRRLTRNKQLCRSEESS